MRDRAPAPREEVEAFLRERPEWSLADGRLRREFRFPSFVAAFGFMASAALVAERMDHHPDWRNSYDRVEVELVTHDVGAVTAHDLALGAAMEGLAAHLPKPGRTAPER